MVLGGFVNYGAELLYTCYHEVPVSITIYCGEVAGLVGVNLDLFHCRQVGSYSSLRRYVWFIMILYVVIIVDG